MYLLTHLDNPEDLLAAAEAAFLVKSMALGRHACGAWTTPAPVTPADFLAWIEDEAALQEEQAADHPGEYDDRFAEALILRSLACHLRCLGVTPSPLPWEVADA